MNLIFMVAKCTMSLENSNFYVLTQRHELFTCNVYGSCSNQLNSEMFYDVMKRQQTRKLNSILDVNEYYN